LGPGAIDLRNGCGKSDGSIVLFPARSWLDMPSLRLKTTHRCYLDKAQNKPEPIGGAMIAATEKAGEDRWMSAHGAQAWLNSAMRCGHRSLKRRSHCRFKPIP
jgi:hypothetical protein